jgi:hypothetical protein
MSLPVVDTQARAVIDRWHATRGHLKPKDDPGSRAVLAMVAELRAMLEDGDDDGQIVADNVEKLLVTFEKRAYHQNQPKEEQ